MWSQLNIPVERIRVVSMDEGMPDPGQRTSSSFTCGWMGVTFMNCNGQFRCHPCRFGHREKPGLPTFADAAATICIRLAGVGRLADQPLTERTGGGESRTWANAQRFAQEAVVEKISEVDVISFGVHAILRAMFRKACGPFRSLLA